MCHKAIYLCFALTPPARSDHWQPIVGTRKTFPLVTKVGTRLNGSLPRTRSLLLLILIICIFGCVVCDDMPSSQVAPLRPKPDQLVAVPVPQATRIQQPPSTSLRKSIALARTAPPPLHTLSSVDVAPSDTRSKVSAEDIDKFLEAANEALRDSIASLNQTSESSTESEDSLPDHSPVPNEPTTDTVANGTNVSHKSPIVFLLPVAENFDLDALVNSLLQNRSTSVDNRLFRTGRETHDAFIKRILNAVSGESHKISRLGGQRPKSSIGTPVKTSKPHKQLSTESSGDQHNDLGLPAEIANEYIDGVNPPKFPGVKTTATVHERRHKTRVKTSETPKKNSGGTKGHSNTQTFTVGVNVGSRLSVNNRNVVNKNPKNKTITINTTTTSSTASSNSSKIHQSNTNPDLTFLLKQEFDAKNAALNQSHLGNFSPIPSSHHNPSDSATVLSKPNQRIISTNSQQELERLLSNLTQQRPLFMGPPYQLPLAPMSKLHNSFNSSIFHANDNLNWVKHKAAIMPASTSSSTTTSTTTASPINQSALKPVNQITKMSSENVFYRVKVPKIRGYHKPGQLMKRLHSRPTVTTGQQEPSANPSNSYNLNHLFPSVTHLSTPEFVTSISNDVRYQVDVRYTDSNSTQLSPVTKQNINEVELSSDESRFSSSNPGISSVASVNITSISGNELDADQSSSGHVPNSSYRLTTERLAYILIGSCCALSVICLVIVAMSVRFKDMCDEYQSWKKAEKEALRWHRQHRLRMAHNDFLLPYHLRENVFNKNRLNLPRYFRTSIGESTKAGNPSQPAYLNKSDKMLETILSATKLPEMSNSSGSSCCHCINCSSTWFLRDQKMGDWCCQRGFLQPTRRSKLPFGAGSSVNTFMPRFNLNPHGPIKSVHDIDMNTDDGDDTNVCTNIAQDGADKASEMCINRNNQSLSEKSNGTHWTRVAKHTESRLVNNPTSAGIKPSKANKYFSEMSELNNSKCKLKRNSSSAIFEGENDPEENETEVDFDPSHNFHEIRRYNKGGYYPTHTDEASQCHLLHTSRLTNAFTPKCSNAASVPKSGPNTNSNIPVCKGKPASTGLYYQNQCKYYFDSPTITRKKPHKSSAHNNSNGECSSIWINSSKIVDKLHRKHLNRHTPVAKSSKQRLAYHGRHMIGSAAPLVNGGGSRRHPHPSMAYFKSALHHHMEPVPVFPRFGYQSKLAYDNEQNFVVWNNDTSDRLI